MWSLRVIPDPLLGQSSCEWCGGWENLGRLRHESAGIEYVTCARCYVRMFRGRGY
jgi:hypothetical protein